MKLDREVCPYLFSLSLNLEEELLVMANTSATFAQLAVHSSTFIAFLNSSAVS